MNIIENIGSLDRGVRMVVGLGLMALAYVGTLPAWAGYIGVVPLATGLAGFCPLYRMLGISTAAGQP
jgi:hypothetical protein